MHMSGRGSGVVTQQKQTLTPDDLKCEVMTSGGKNGDGPRMEAPRGGNQLETAQIIDSSTFLNEDQLETGMRYAP